MLYRIPLMEGGACVAAGLLFPPVASVITSCPSFRAPETTSVKDPSETPVVISTGTGLPPGTGVHTRLTGAGPSVVSGRCIWSYFFYCASVSSERIFWRLVKRNSLPLAFASSAPPAL